MYLDDMLGAHSDRHQCVVQSEQVKSDLILSGFVPKAEKSLWVPVQCLTFLGNIINTEEGLLSIPDYRILRAKSCFEELIKIGEQGRSVQVRKLAKCTGHIISMSLVFGSATQLMTRSMSMQIAGTSSWNESVQLNEQSREEVKFWDRNIDVRNKCPLRFESKCHILVYSDASSTGFGGYCVESLEGVLSQGLWRECDMSRSSTWRALTAVCQVLKSLVCFLEGKRVKWFSYNQGVVSIVEKGSMKSDLQSIALSINEACCANNIKLEMAWVPRSDNERTDYLSRIDDPDDWAISPKIFLQLSNLWGSFEVDWFASFYNNKHPVFYSRFWNHQQAWMPFPLIGLVKMGGLYHQFI
ncbi:uncharacterized protein [Argopecten irradians]|uniref:uncharacterized protein isoform X1 n=1 Tax=Argopecten irradians TaxID=31199 RepID=UPI00371A5ED7